MNKTEVYRFVKKETQSILFTSVSADLNGDDIKDLLVGVDCSPGVSCIYYCFRNVKGNYDFIGTAYLNKSSFEVLKARHNGYCDIMSYEPKLKYSGYETKREKAPIKTEPPKIYRKRKLAPHEYKAIKRKIEAAKKQVMQEQSDKDRKYDDNRAKGQGVLSRLQYNGKNYELKKSVIGRDDLRELLHPSGKKQDTQEK